MILDSLLEINNTKQEICKCRYSCSCLPNVLCFCDLFSFWVYNVLFVDES